MLYASYLAVKRLLDTLLHSALRTTELIERTCNYELDHSHRSTNSHTLPCVFTGEIVIVGLKKKYKIALNGLRMYLECKLEAVLGLIFGLAGCGCGPLLQMLPIL